MDSNSYFGLGGFIGLLLHPGASRLGVLLVACLPLVACATTTANPDAANGDIVASAAEVAHDMVPGQITTVRLSQVGDQNCTKGQIPVTFGQPFRRGDVPPEQTVQAYLRGKPLPTQTDIRVRNKKGSARHAVITVLVPCNKVENDTARVALATQPQPPQSNTDTTVTIRDVLQSEFGASVALDVSGKTWTLDARQLLKIIAQKGGCKAADNICTPWLSGPLVSEWVVGGPLVDDTGKPHPHLAAYFAVRAYGPAPVTRVRVDVVLENDWTYVPNPHNYTYDATIAVGGKGVYGITDLTHYRQARWHKVFWWGDPGVLYAALDSDYLQASRAVPKYQDIQPSRKTLLQARQACMPMHHCDQTATMGNTGSQVAIGPLPQWTTAYVLDTGYRAYRWMLANSDALGAYGIHYRDKSTGAPISIKAHPCMTLQGSAATSRCPVAPHGDDRLPGCKGDCDSPLDADRAHHPAPAYVAYMVTGDWYYMGELQFWANWLIFWQNPNYREFAEGLIHQTQVRGQGWALRTLGDAAYILPRRAPLGDYFDRVIRNNIRWYNANYTDNPDANALRIIPGYHAVIYSNRTAMAPWQQSFFMWALGSLADKGFEGAERLRDWFAPFQIGLMTDPEFCSELASSYTLKVRDSRNSPLYKNLGEVYRKSFPKLAAKAPACHSKAVNAAIKGRDKRNFHYPPGTMVGYPYSATGFVANFQIGLAAAVDSGLPAAERAWQVFVNSPVRPNYGWAPQFAVVPRTVNR